MHIRHKNHFKHSSSVNVWQDQNSKSKNTAVVLWATWHLCSVCSPYFGFILFWLRLNNNFVICSSVRGGIYSLSSQGILISISHYCKKVKWCISVCSCCIIELFLNEGSFHFVMEMLRIKFSIYDLHMWILAWISKVQLLEVHTWNPVSFPPPTCFQGCTP